MTILGPVVDGFDDGTELGALLFVEAGAFGFDASDFFAAGAGAAGQQVGARRSHEQHGEELGFHGKEVLSWVRLRVEGKRERKALAAAFRLERITELKDLKSVYALNFAAYIQQSRVKPGRRLLNLLSKQIWNRIRHLGRHFAA